MSLRRSFAISALVLATSGLFAHADAVFGSDTPILTGLKDQSNITSDSGGYQLNVFHPATDPDLYINALHLNFGANWNAAIPLTSPPTTLPIFDGTYTLGTPISGEHFYFFNGFVRVAGQVPADVPNDIYSFSVDVIGGADASATDNLATLNYQLEVFDRIDVTLSGFTDPAEITPGGSTTVSMKVQNNMASRNFVSTTWWRFVDSFTNGTDHLTDGDFVGDWFNKTILPGDSRTDLHTIIHSAPGISTGLYTGGMGVDGGLYNGDTFEFSFNPTVTVVPEPTSAALALALPALALRRRRR